MQINIDRNEMKSVIYGDGLIIVPKRKEDPYIRGQRTVTLKEQKHIMDMLWTKYLSNLKNSEIKVLFFIIARTFGFNKLKENIQIKTFEKGFISKENERVQYGTGLSSSACHRALNLLCSLGYIKKEVNFCHENGNKMPSTFSINLDFFNREVLQECYGLSPEAIDYILQSQIFKSSRQLENKDLGLLEEEGF